MRDHLIDCREVEAKNGHKCDEEVVKSWKSSLLLIWLRGILLLITTLNLFINVYIMLSLDRFMISYALMAMTSSIFGQLAAIFGQFGYKSGKYLSIIYALAALSLVLVTAVLGRVGQNLLLNISLALAAVSGLISAFVALKD